MIEHNKARSGEKEDSGKFRRTGDAYIQIKEKFSSCNANKKVARCANKKMEPGDRYDLHLLFSVGTISNSLLLSHYLC